MSVTLPLEIQPNVYYTIDEAAQLLRVRSEEVFEMLRSGRVRGIQIGQQWRILGGTLLDLGNGAVELDEADYAALDQLVGMVETGDTTASIGHDARIYRR